MGEVTEEQGKRRDVGYCKPPVEHQFKPGQSGNPGGRPKGTSLMALLRARLEATDDATGKTYGERLAEALVDTALDGNVSAIKEVLDRIEGKVPDKVQVDDLRKAYVTESPDTLWPSDLSNAPTNPAEPPEHSGETPDPRS